MGRYLVDELLRSLSLSFGGVDGADKLALRPHEVNDRSVINIVAFTLFTLYLVCVNFETIQHPPVILVIFVLPCQSHYRAIEQLHVLSYLLRSVSFGVDRNEHRP